MMTNLVGLLLLCVVLLAAFISLASVAFIFYRQLTQRLSTLQQRQDKLQNELRLLLNADLLIEKRYTKLAKNLRDAEHNITNLETQSQADNSYKQAIKMAEMGAEASDLMATCSLSEAEAKLLLHLRGYKSSVRHQ